MKIASHLLNLEYEPGHDMLMMEWPGYDSALSSQRQYALKEAMAALGTTT